MASNRSAGRSGRCAFAAPTASTTIASSSGEITGAGGVAGTDTGAGATASTSSARAADPDDAGPVSGPRT